MRPKSAPPSGKSPPAVRRRRRLGGKPGRGAQRRERRAAPVEARAPAPPGRAPARRRRLTRRDLDDAAAHAQAEDRVPGEVVPAGELRRAAGRIEQHDRRRRPRGPGRAAARRDRRRGAGQTVRADRHAGGGPGARRRPATPRRVVVLGLAERAELGVVAHEAEAHEPGGAVAVLGDLELDDALGGGVAGVLVDEHHHVGVLLDGARLAQVGELRLAVGARLGRAVELRHGDDRHVQLARQLLHRARDVGDLLLAVLGARVAGHQLQVVDDDQRRAAAWPAGAAPWRAARTC